MKKIYIKFDHSKVNDDNEYDAEPLKGVHLDHPFIADYTLCSMAISDNDAGLTYQSYENGRVTCDSCKTTIEYCKSK